MTKTTAKTKTKPSDLDRLKALLQADGVSAETLEHWDGMVAAPDTMALPDGDNCMRIANYIGWTDVADANREYMSITTPGDVKDFLDANADGDVTFLLNTPGGSVFGGMEISNLIIGHEGKTTAIVTGIAASCGSLIAAACDEVLMMEASMVMIHGPQTFAYGGADDLRDVADRLDKESSAASTIYKRRLEADDVDRMMASGDHYFTADEAVESGFADGIYADDSDDDSDSDSGGTAADDSAQINTGSKMEDEADCKAAKAEPRPP